MSEEKESLADMLLNGKAVVSYTHGKSMEPLLHEGKTQVVIKPLTPKPEIGDILLWWRWDGMYILHRMVGETEDRYILRGDNAIKTNRALKSRVIGVVTDIQRNGKWFPVTDKRYLAYVRFWTAIYPLRYRCYKIQSGVNRKIGKFKSVLKGKAKAA